ncbi:hypothetical protein M758_9G042600 [Ceratodon purpureus]|nr:hypothetical protein M758_9G042600 [Ceratodon purpureus]
MIETPIRSCIEFHALINQSTNLHALPRPFTPPSYNFGSRQSREQRAKESRLQSEGGNRAMAHGALGFKRRGWTGERMRSFVNWTPGGEGDAVEEVGRAEGAWTGGLDGGAGDRGTQP